MNSVRTTFYEELKRLFLLFDYLLWFFIDPSKLNSVHNNQIKRVLIIHRGAIGELVISTPIISTLKEKLDCDIELMVQKGKEQILKENPHISNIFAYQGSFEKDLNQIKKKKFDLAVIINPASFKMAFLCLRAGIRYRIGGFSGFKRFPTILFTRRSFPLHRKHTVERVLDILRKINLDNPSPKIEFYYSKEDKKKAMLALKKLGVKDYAVIHPGFGSSTNNKFPTRYWPAERYAKVADHIIKEHSFPILLTGEKEETLFSKEISRRAKNKNRVIITNGLFNFGELAYVVSKARLLICPSTSVTHLAEAYETPLIDLSGKLFLYEWLPFMKKEKYRAHYHNEVCTGCNLMDCPRKTIECMYAIKTKEVVRSVDELLSKRNISPAT